MLANFSPWRRKLLLFIPQMHCRQFATPASSKAAAASATKSASSSSSATNSSGAGGINVASLTVFKDVPPPTLNPDSAYPQWIFESRNGALPPLRELIRRAKASAPMSREDSKRIIKLQRKDKIKQHNELSAKA